MFATGLNCSSCGQDFHFATSLYIHSKKCSSRFHGKLYGFWFSSSFKHSIVYDHEGGQFEWAVTNEVPSMGPVQIRMFIAVVCHHRLMQSCYIKLLLLQRWTSRVQVLILVIKIPVSSMNISEQAPLNDMSAMLHPAETICAATGFWVENCGQLNS